MAPLRPCRRPTGTRAPPHTDGTICSTSRISIWLTPRDAHKAPISAKGVYSAREAKVAPTNGNAERRICSANPSVCSRRTTRLVLCNKGTKREKERLVSPSLCWRRSVIPSMVLPPYSARGKAEALVIICLLVLQYSRPIPQEQGRENSITNIKKDISVAALSRAGN